MTAIAEPGHARPVGLQARLYFAKKAGALFQAHLRWQLLYRYLSFAAHIYLDQSSNNALLALFVMKNGAVRMKFRSLNNLD
jgi:hypothetical protein